MSAADSVNGHAAAPIRRLLPGAEPHDGDALRALADAGAHFLLVGHNKVPFVEKWQKNPASIDDVLQHAGRGGLTGMVPGSIGAVVIDLDPNPEGDGDTTPPLGQPVLQHVTRRAGGVHYWYKAPAGEVGNRQWARTVDGKLAGEIRGSNGFVVLWDCGAVAAAVVGDDFSMANEVDVDILPRPAKPKDAKTGRLLTGVEAVAAAVEGARNGTLFTESCFAIERGEDLAPMRKAALASGLPEREVDATLASATATAQPGKRAPTASATTGLVLSEADLGASYTRLHNGDRLHRSDGVWLRWQDEQGWTVDPEAAATLAEVMRLGRDTFCRNTKEGPKFDARTGGRASTARGALTYARADCWSDTGAWDVNPWMLGVPGGQVVDLHNGDIRPRTRADLIERSVAAVPAQEWRGTRWDGFLHEMIAADAQEWLRVLCGYALTGLTREHVVLFIYGRTRTGKGTLLSAIADAVGDYARRIDADDLMEQKTRDHPAWLADLRGRRLVVADEIPRGRAWNTARIKALVSGESIRARMLYGQFFEFKPAAQLVIAGNHAPAQSSADTGLSSRLRVMRAERQPEVVDQHLLDKLRPEHVLSWLIEGSAQYHIEGLRPTPASVEAGTLAYAKQSDLLGEFIDSWFTWPVRISDFYKQYRAWVDADGGYPLGKQRFNSTLREDYHFQEFTPRGGSSSWREPKS